MLKIEIITDTLSLEEARGLVSLFREIYPEIAEVGRQITNTPVTIASLGMTEDLASDGYPADAPNMAEHLAVHSGDVVESVRTNPYDRTGVPRDTAGTPWDERIHSSTKTTNKDGTWTRRRNTPDATFDAVMAELKATPAVVAVPAPPTAEPTAAEAFTPPATVPAPPPTQAAATEQAAQNAVAAASVPGAPSFVEIMKKVTTLQSAGKLPKAQLDEYLGSVGVEGIGKMATASADIRSAFGAILDGIA